jgi:hypothetical protein
MSQSTLPTLDNANLLGQGFDIFGPYTVDSLLRVSLRKSLPNGMIAKDKFCLSRHHRLELSHWRLNVAERPISERL